MILNSPCERDSILIACLRILFPECEIEVRSQVTEGPENIQGDHMPFNPDIGEKGVTKILIAND